MLVTMIPDASEESTASAAAAPDDAAAEIDAAEAAASEASVPAAAVTAEDDASVETAEAAAEDASAAAVFAAAEVDAVAVAAEDADDAACCFPCVPPVLPHAAVVKVSAARITAAYALFFMPASLDFLFRMIRTGMADTPIPACMF
jgi:hypothetical protein